MKKLILISCLLLVAGQIIHAQKSDFLKLNGPYLGQKPPGMTPEIFAPDIISTGLSEGTCVFMPDNNEMIYSVIYQKPHSHKVIASLVTSKVRNGIWSSPEVMEFSGARWLDGSPFISYEGTELFFQSDRPTGKEELKNKYNFWRCKRTADGWGVPEPLPAPINGRGDVSGPSLSKTGDFYFTLSNPDTKDAIYTSRYDNGRFSEPIRLPDAVNVKEGSFDGVISPDGSYYIVCVYSKEDSFGETDLFVTFKRKNNTWTNLFNLGKTINTRFADGAATISPDGKYVFFSGYLVSHNYYNDTLTYRDILNYNLKPQYGNSDIYWVSSKIIEELRPKGNSK